MACGIRKNRKGVNGKVLRNMQIYKNNLLRSIKCKTFSHQKKTEHMEIFPYKWQSLHVYNIYLNDTCSLLCVRLKSV